MFNKDCRLWKMGNLIILSVKRLLSNITSYIIVYKSYFITSLKYITDSVFLGNLVFQIDVKGIFYIKKSWHFPFRCSRGCYKICVTIYCVLTDLQISRKISKQPSPLYRFSQCNCQLSATVGIKIQFDPGQARLEINPKWPLFKPQERKPQFRGPRLGLGLLCWLKVTEHERKRTFFTCATARK